MAKVVLRVKPPVGDEGENNMYVSPNRTALDQRFDLRDRLSELVGKGNTLSPDDKAAIYGSLAASFGKDKAQKIMTHAYIFNARPEVQKLGLEDKLRSFYTVGSNDPDVMDVITKTKNLGYGVVPGFTGSSSDMNQRLLGKTADVAANASPEVKKKVMIRVGK
jgi:hypothetical protein